MVFQSGRGLLLLSLLLCLSHVQAEEANFGKSTPSEEKIIELFKSDTADVEPGIKTRGINIIETGKSNPRHKPVTPVLEEKAISMEILFDYNSATLTEQAKTQLRPVGAAMASDDLKGLSFRIEGHTDAIGGDQFNIDLSRRRAEAVKAFLSEQYRLGDTPIQIVGKGKKDLADKANPDSEVNRRVRIVRLAQ
ncbi:MAG: OmpA family protein [Methylococcaceae bacterium]|nr:OmpA family protein [Methylococcaceae bacterium]